jgi:hypothetical protein
MRPNAVTPPRTRSFTINDPSTFFGPSNVSKYRADRKYTQVRVSTLSTKPMLSLLLNTEKANEKSP